MRGVTKRRYSYRAYPSGEQERALARVFGCTRLVYNIAIEAIQRDWESGIPYRGASVLQHEVLTRGKQVRPFLRDVSGVPLIQAVRDADQAMRAFFDSRGGRRRGKRVGMPRFKSKRSRRDAARFTSASSAGGLRVREIPGTAWGEVFLPKVGWLRYRSSRPLPSQPSSVSVIRTPDGWVHVSFVVEAEDTHHHPHGDRPVAGVDLGLTDLVSIARTDGTRQKIQAPKYLRRQERKLARAQRELARRQAGSRNREKSRRKVACIHRKVRETRRDGHRKLALDLVRENQALGIESLGIAGLVKSRLAKSVHDAGWGIFIRFLEEKAAAYGCEVVRVDRFFPSSKTCSQCGHVREQQLGLGIRSWNCHACTALLDRDWNAAVNLALVAVGHTETKNACGGDVSRAGVRRCAAPSPERQPRLCGEAGPHRTSHPLRVAA